MNQVVGTTALIESVKCDKREICQILIENGADVNLTEGTSALNWAIFKGRTELFNMLLSSGADIKSASPFQEAIRRERVEMAKTLVEMGATVTIKSLNSWQKSLLHETASTQYCGSQGSLHYLLTSGLVNQDDINSHDPAISKCNRIEFVRGFTPLLLACQRCQADNMEILLQHGADSDLRSYTDCSPLMTTLWRATDPGNYGTTALKVLLRHGCSIDQRQSIDEKFPIGEDGEEEKLDDVLPFEFAVRSMVLGSAQMLWLVGSKEGNVRTSDYTRKFWMSDFDGPECSADWMNYKKFTKPAKREMLSFIRDCCSQPRKLSNICCIVIRTLLVQKIQSKVKKLGVPNNVQDLINLPELDQIDQEAMEKMDVLAEALDEME